MLYHNAQGAYMLERDEASQRRASADASVGSNRWLGRRERSKQGQPAGAAHRAVKPSAKRSAQRCGSGALSSVACIRLVGLTSQMLEGPRRKPGRLRRMFLPALRIQD